MGLIYMRISPSGGKYIGKTTSNENDRWRDHVKESKDIRDDNYHSILNRAIRKYGEENFTVKILEDNIPEEFLNDREIYWIDYYKTYYLDNQHGYNMTYGGDGRRKYNYKDFLNLWYAGNTLTEISNLYRIDIGTISKYLKDSGITSEEIQKRGSNVACEKRSLKVKQFDLNGNFIKEWDSISSASRALKISTSSISRVCKRINGSISCSNFLWVYSDDNIDIQELVNQKRKNNRINQPIICLETNQLFNNQKEASEFFQVDRHTIRDACRTGKPMRKNKMHLQYYKGE